MKLSQTNKLVGHWTGKIPDISAELYFNEDGSGTISYSNLKKVINFNYSIRNDSILTLVRGVTKSEHYFKISDTKLQLRPLKFDEETIDIINEFIFVFAPYKE